MAQVTTRDVTVNGVRSLVRTSGDDTAKEAVVFVHGNPGSSEDFAALMPAVGDFARTVAADLPGYGKAARPGDFDYTVPGYARHLDGVLAQLGVEKVHLGLHDFGGPFGLQWAANNPERVKSFVLFNMGAMPGYRWHKFARVWRTPLLGELFQATTTRAAFRWALQAENPRPFPPGFLDRMYEDADPAMRRAVLKLYRATDIGALSAGLADKLKSRRYPALVVWGEGDKYTPVRFAEVQKEYFDAETHVLPRCGHWPMIDEPELVRDLVVKFLRPRFAAN